MKTDKPEINIKNKKAFFDYEILETYTAGIQLVGSEIKSIREGHITLKGSYCFVDKEEIFVKGMEISTYKYSNKSTLVSTLCSVIACCCPFCDYYLSKPDNTTE